MRDQRKLGVARLSAELAIAVYRLTASFPASERFGLADQMRRAAVSVGSNIAEGAGRSGDREFLRFVRIAYASASALAFQLNIASELDFGAEGDRASITEAIDHLQRMLTRLARSLNARRITEPSTRE